MDKQIHVNMDTNVYFVIQIGQVSDGGVISVSRHVNSYNIVVSTCSKLLFSDFRHYKS